MVIEYTRNAAGSKTAKFEVGRKLSALPTGRLLLTRPYTNIHLTSLILKLV